jgi:hypothetical protein
MANGEGHIDGSFVAMCAKRVEGTKDGAGPTEAQTA